MTVITSGLQHNSWVGISFATEATLSCMLLKQFGKIWQTKNKKAGATQRACQLGESPVNRFARPGRPVLPELSITIDLSLLSD